MDFKELKLRKNILTGNITNVLKVSSCAVNKWERGENFPTLNMLIQLKSLFNVSYDDLIESLIESRNKSKKTTDVHASGKQRNTDSTN